MSDKKIMKTLNGYTVYDEEAHRRIDSLAGSAPGLVFDTVADMEAYVAEHSAELKVGQNLYIREVDVPDYWWDGTAAQKLETKVDLSGYAKQEEVERLSEAIANLGGSLVEPADDDIPKVYFTGTLPTSKADDDVRVKIHYISKTADFTYPATLKVQGSTSANYPKKNFTLKLYEDETYESKVKLAFKNWGKMNKFVLKAHWIDCSHVRNVGTAKIWGKIVKSRSDYDSLPEELRSAPNSGATDGFTCKVFANGVYQGLYEWIVPKDKLFGQDSDIATHSIMNSEYNNQASCTFSTSTPVVTGNWSEELQDEMSAGIETSFANFITFVASASDAEFVANAEKYFDVQSVIDFDIFARLFCTVDSLGKNQIFFTYDGVKWYEGVWDVDAVLGLHPWLGNWFAYNTEFQTGYVAYKEGGLINMLYKRVEELFLDRFKARYHELRATVLTTENIIDVYERLTDVITTYDGLLAEDYASTTGGGAFTGIPYKTENNIQQIRNFAAQRIPYMDSVVDGLTAPVHCTGITLDTMTISFNGIGKTQKLTATVTPTDTTDAVVWVSSNPDIAKVEDGTVTSVAIGEAVITATCGSHSVDCAVSVEFEEIACTGVSLSDNTLTFTGEGNQSLTVNVMPEGCTDNVAWESDNTDVATVENGIVTAVGNGSATITVTCGDYSDTCEVTVEGIAENILREIAWNVGEANESGALVTTNANGRYTDLIDVSEYRGTSLCIKTPAVSWSKVVFYDESESFVSYVKTEDDANAFPVPSTAKYMRISRPSGVGNNIVVLGCDNNLFKSCTLNAGSYNASGFNANDSGSNHIKITGTIAEEYILYDVWGFTCLDESDTVLEHKQMTYKKSEFHTPVDGTYSIAVSTGIAKNETAVCCVPVQIGSSVIGG